MANTVDLFSYLPGIQVTTNEVLEAEMLAEQLLQSKFPDLDLREGTALRDLVIRPNATLLAMIRKASAFYFSQSSIDGVTNTSSTAFVDSMMSNWFLTRKQGSKAIINARLFFARQKNVNIPQDSFFSPDNTLKFYPGAYMSFTASQLTFDAYSSSYYIDVDLVAEAAGKSYEISTGGLVYFSTFDPYFLRAEINFLRQTAIDAETNSQFVGRASTSISTRNLVNLPSISSKILQDFGAVKGVQVAGMADVEMWRDQVQVVAPTVNDPIWIHTGGMVDVYCRTSPVNGVVQVSTDATGKALLTGPIYKITRSTISGGVNPDLIASNATYTVSNYYNKTGSVVSITQAAGTATATLANHGFIPGRFVTIAGAAVAAYNGVKKILACPTKDTFTFSVPTTTVTPASGAITCTSVTPSKDFGFSNYQTLVVDFGLTNANKTASFNIYYFQDIDGMQVYLEDPVQRIAAGNYLARGFNSYFLDITITGYNGPAPSSDAAMTVVQNYVDGLAPGATFIMSDLLSNLYAAGIQTIKTPLTITYTLYNKDLTAPVTGVITDTLNPNDSMAIFVANSVTTNSTNA